MKLELTKEKVGIIGCATSKNLAPFDDESWEFWGVNNLFLTPLSVKQNGDKPPVLVKWDKWFEIHFIEKNGTQWNRRWNKEFRKQDMNHYIEDLKKLPCPIIMQKQWPEIPNSVVYPLAEVLSKYGEYFTNSISYEIALAIHLGAKEIGIWGVDMAVHTEYHYQRPSCEYFVGLARGKGIKVHIPAEADLCKTMFLYGFQEKEKHDWRKKTDNIKIGIQKQLENAKAQKELYAMKEQQAIGAFQAIIEEQKIWD